jgi:hypothetical protein
VVGVSHFVYGFNDAELRRSGTLTPTQRQRRAVLETCFGRPDPQATRQAIGELVGRIVPFGGEAEVHSDLHTAYWPALRQLPARAIRHRTTSSRAARTTRNPLFPANLADLLLRHTGANHKRETIAFSKRRQGALYRAAIWLVWRNYVKSTSEKRRDDPPAVRLSTSEKRRDDPPAVRLGIIARRMTLGEILRERQLPWRVALRGWLERCYFGRIPTRRIRRCREHRLRYAV